MKPKPDEVKPEIAVDGEQYLDDYLEECENRFQETIVRRAVKHEELISAASWHDEGSLFVTFLEGKSKFEGVEGDGLPIFNGIDFDPHDYGGGDMYEPLAFAIHRGWQGLSPGRWVFFWPKRMSLPPDYEIEVSDIAVEKASFSMPWEKFAAHPDATTKWLTPW